METRFAKTASACGICFGLVEIQGALDSCTHTYCQACILKWSEVGLRQTENRCPLCKRRFSRVDRVLKRVEYANRKEEASKVVPDKSQQEEWSPGELSRLLEYAQTIVRSL